MIDDGRENTMSTATTPSIEHSVEEAKLQMALELGQKWWKVAFGKGFEEKARADSGAEAYGTVR